MDITPTTSRFANFFSIVPDDRSDSAGLTPGLRPFPATAAWEGRLYMIRNACEVNMVDPGAADGPCPAGLEVPQLWRCDPWFSGTPTHCEATDWSLVAEVDGSGRSNMGTPDNRKVSLLIAGNGRLYVGFDNPVSGVQVWRTRTGVSVARDLSDFESVEPGGFGDSGRNRFLSQARVAGGRVFATVGRDAGSFAVFELR
jgi:hypothetical protein